MNPIRIFGGGLAGLSLGIALRQAGAAVTVTEAGHYPRHRVCGEFISGAGQATLESFGLGQVLAGAVPNRETTWFLGNRLLFSEPLPKPALGLSRFQLDQRLAAKFRELDGELTTGEFVRESPSIPGTVWAGGRGGSSPDWIALKLHCRGLDPDYDLAMHLGSRGYVGVSRIEEEKVNVCGLFRTRRGLSPGKSGILSAYLRANGLDDLAGRLDAADTDPASITATTSLNFKSTPWPAAVACIGDANTAIPPFAGNGMSMAFESAHIALPKLLAYAHGETSWTGAREALHQALRRRFRLRLATARLLHPFLLQPRGGRPLSWILSHRILPFHLLYRLLR
ncbi:MAG: hypothetical protein WD490_05685 [Opitutales bacterium]